MSVCTAPDVPPVSIFGGSTAILSAAMPLAVSRDFMNSEMTTILFRRDIAAIRRRCEKTRRRAGFQLRQSGAQNRHGQRPPARLQLRPMGV